MSALLCESLSILVWKLSEVTTTDNKHYSSSENKLFVIKPVSDSIFGHLNDFKTEFSGNPRLRNHVDQVDRDKIVIYEFFKTDLRSLTEKYPPLPRATKKAILKEIALVLNDMHEKDWIHLGKLTSHWILKFTYHFQTLSPITFLSIGILTQTVNFGCRRSFLETWTVRWSSTVRIY